MEKTSLSSQKYFLFQTTRLIVGKLVFVRKIHILHKKRASLMDNSCNRDFKLKTRFSSEKYYFASETSLQHKRKKHENKLIFGNYRASAANRKKILNVNLHNGCPGVNCNRFSVTHLTPTRWGKTVTSNLKNILNVLRMPSKYSKK